MPDLNEAMLEMAKNLWNNYFQQKVTEMMAMSLRFYRARVITAPSNGKIVVQQPFDVEQTLPYVSSAASLTAGQECIVLVLGSTINSIVIGDGMLTNL